MELIPIINAQLQNELSRCKEENRHLKRMISQLVTKKVKSRSRGITGLKDSDRNKILNAITKNCPEADAAKVVLEL